MKCEQLNNFQKKMLGNGTTSALIEKYGGRSPGPTSIHINKLHIDQNTHEKHDLRHHEVGSRSRSLR